MAEPLVSNNHSSATFVVASRPDIPFPLVLERSFALGPDVDQALRLVEVWAGLDAPFLKLIDCQREGTTLDITFERFTGVTAANATRVLDRRSRCLPLDAWWRLAQDVFDACELEQWPGTLQAMGWTFTGELRIAPRSLTSLLDGLNPRPSRMAPEVPDGGALTPRARVFSTATLLARLLTGVPFDLELTPVSPRRFHPFVTESLDRVWLRATDADPEKRWATVGELRTAMAEVIEVPSVSRDEAFGCLSGLAWHEVDATLSSLWEHEYSLPKRWTGVWPNDVHALHGLSVLEDRLLEHRRPLRSLPSWKPASLRRSDHDTPPPTMNRSGDSPVPQRTLTQLARWFRNLFTED